MIKANGHLPSGRRFVLFGLSRRNTELLLEGKPIEIDLQKDMNMPFPLRVVICAGEPEQELAQKICAGTDVSEAVIHRDEAKDHGEQG